MEKMAVVAMVAGGRRKRGRKKKEREDGPVHSGTHAYEEVCGAPSRPTRSEYRTTPNGGDFSCPAHDTGGEKAAEQTSSSLSPQSPPRSVPRWSQSPKSPAPPVRSSVLNCSRLLSMVVLHDTTGKKKEAVVCYMDAPVPYAIEENYGGCFFEDDADLALVLQDQEIVYQLLQGNDGSGSSRTHSYPSSSCGHQRTLVEPKLRGGENDESQLAVDEALARELQEMEDLISNTLIDGNILKEGNKPVSSSTPHRGNTSASRSPQVVMEDSVDPDNMTYEELQQLGETIGTESKGLPEDMIALLKSSTYKIRIFSRKEKYDECVICCMTYKNRDKLTTLPCAHQYHQTCVAKWLKINKVCPVCNKEVFGS